MGGEAGFYYSSGLGTAEGAQKAGQMKMGSKEMWTIAQFNSDYSYSYERLETVSADRLELQCRGSGGLQN